MVIGWRLCADCRWALGYHGKVNHGVQVGRLNHHTLDNLSTTHQMWDGPVTPRPNTGFEDFVPGRQDRSHEQ